MNKKFEKLGFYPADILLPKDQDMRKWAVVFFFSFFGFFSFAAFSFLGFFSFFPFFF